MICNICKQDVEGGGHVCSDGQEHLAECTVCAVFHEPHCQTGSRAAEALREIGQADDTRVTHEDARLKRRLEIAEQVHAHREAARIASDKS